LERVREVLTIVERGSGKCALDSEITGGLNGKVIEITPGAIGGDDDLRVVREIELDCVNR
jgi:hypothetical protein